MDEVLPPVMVVLCATVLVAATTAGLPREDALLLRVSFCAHIVSAVTLLYAMDNVFIQSDAHWYLEAGGMLANLMRADFFTWTPEALRLLLQIHHSLPPDLFGAGSSTSSMVAVTGLGMFFVSSSPYAVSLLFAVFSFFGKWAMCRGLQETIGRRGLNRQVILATTLVPSVVFWTSGIVKEGFAMVGLGLATLGLSRLVRGARTSRAVYLVAGCEIVFLFKPYLLFPFVVASGGWYYIQRAGERAVAPRPVYLALGGLAAFGGVAALGVLLPQFSVERLGESTANLQRMAAYTGGGSTYSLGFEPTNALSGQLLFAPLALITSLARPFLFEVHNLSAFLAASEMTVMLVILGRGIASNTIGALWRRVSSSPVLAFASIFTLLGGTAVGLATTNFGTLSRYRVPMMPFYIFLILMLSVRQRTWDASVKPKQPTPSAKSSRTTQPAITNIVPARQRMR